MKMNEIVAPSMKTLFVKEIERLILTGQLAIGERLPTEREMSEQMKISKTTTNAGIAELVRKGFLEVIPRKGIFVADYKRNGTLDTLIAIIEFDGGRFDRQTFRSLMDFRMLLEGENASCAAVNRSEEDLRRMEDRYRRVLACESLQDVARQKMLFFHDIACATGNAIYPLVLNSFREIIVVFHEIIYRRIGMEEAARHMRELIDAIRRRDAEQAKAIMQASLQVRIEDLEQQYFD